MLLILTLLLLFVFPSTSAWAYFDPGFGGNYFNSIISLLVSCFAFIFASIIYFFRRIFGQQFLPFWERHQKILSVISLYALNIGCAALGWYLFGTCQKDFTLTTLLVRTYLDPHFGIQFIALIFTFVVVILILSCLTLIFWKRFKNIQAITTIIVLCLINASVGAFLCSNHLRLLAHQALSQSPKFTDPQRTNKGYTLFEGTLYDENGRVIKRWSHGYLGIIDDNGDFYGNKEENTSNPNPTWGRYTWDDKAIWEKHFFIHHELYLSPQGTIVTFIKEDKKYNNFNVDFDIILEFDKNGNELQRYSLYDHLKEFQRYTPQFGIDACPTIFLRPLMLFWDTLYHSPLGGSYDYFHLNSFFVLPPNPLEAQNPAFRHGNWLISSFNGSAVFILDQNTHQILWHMNGSDIKGEIQGQHAVSMLPDGNILLFDNGINRNASRILIINPITFKIVWEYAKDDFFSPVKGFVQKLPNGNFLVTESEKKHVFEITADKTIVWDFYPTDQDGNRYYHDCYRVTRYSKAMIEHFLQH